MIVICFNTLFILTESTFKFTGILRSVAATVLKPAPSSTVLWLGILTIREVFPGLSPRSTANFLRILPLQTHNHGQASRPTSFERQWLELSLCCETVRI